MELPELLRIGLPSSGGGDREPVGIEVARPDQTDRDYERDDDEGCTEPEEQVEGHDRPGDEDREPDHQIDGSALVRADLRQQVSALGHVTSSQIVLRTPTIPRRGSSISSGIDVLHLHLAEAGAGPSPGTVSRWRRVTWSCCTVG